MSRHDSLRKWRAVVSPAVALLLPLLHPVLAASPTEGPLAPASLGYETAYSTARACARKCLVYEGPFQCGVNRGYNDLGVAICGCGPLNGCYCNTASAASASSYISSCVNAGCGNLGEEVTSMLNLYNGYCATANAAVETTPAGAVPTGTTPGAGRTSQAPATNTGATPAETAPSGSTEAAQPSKGGLSQSDIVALAASLGVGIPSIVIAAATLWVTMRKRKGKKAEEALQGMPKPAVPTPSSQSSLPAEVPVHQVHEMGNTGPYYGQVYKG
jgi:hypothetical protein